MARTAQALDLHRNTVAARIARIQDLLGIDLGDPDVRLAVHLAVRAVHARESSNDKEPVSELTGSS